LKFPENTATNKVSKYQSVRERSKWQWRDASRQLAGNWLYPPRCIRIKEPRCTLVTKLQKGSSLLPGVPARRPWPKTYLTYCGLCAQKTGQASHSIFLEKMVLQY